MKTFGQFLIEQDPQNGSHQKDREEYFEFEGVRYSIDEANKIIKGRKVTGETDVQKWFDKFVKTGRLSLGVAKPGEIDLREPLLMGMLKVNDKMNGFVIDGWHRIALAYIKGIKKLPYIQLTAEETKKIASVDEGMGYGPVYGVAARVPPESLDTTFGDGWA